MKNPFRFLFDQKQIPSTMYTVCAILSVWGLLSLSSASIGALMSNNGYAAFLGIMQQVAYAALGFFALHAASKIRLVWWQLYAPHMFILAIMVMCSLFTSLSIQVNGAIRWIHLGPITVQPSEFFKIAGIIFISYVLTHPLYRKKK